MIKGNTNSNNWFLRIVDYSFPEIPEIRFRQPECKYNIPCICYKSILLCIPRFLF